MKSPAIVIFDREMLLESVRTCNRGDLYPT